MSNIIKLKRGLSSNVDTLTLERGELALTTDTNELLSVNDAGVIESITPHLLENVTTVYCEPHEFVFDMVPVSYSGWSSSEIQVGQYYTIMVNGNPNPVLATQEVSGIGFHIGRYSIILKNQGAEVYIGSPYIDGESVTLSIVDSKTQIKSEYLPEFSRENTTYVLTKNGTTITLTGSDGSTTAVSDSDTKTIVDGFLDSASTNAIQNKVVYNAINEIPKIYMGDTEPTDLNVLLWIDTGVENTDPVEISFTVGGLRCMGEEGMTWDEWIDSGYNFDPRVAISNSGGIIYRNGSLLQLNGNGVAVQATDIIEPNGVYTTMAFPD